MFHTLSKRILIPAVIGLGIASAAFPQQSGLKALVFKAKGTNGFATLSAVYKEAAFGGAVSQILFVQLHNCPPGGMVDISVQGDFLGSAKADSQGKAVFQFQKSGAPPDLSGRASGWRIDASDVIWAKPRGGLAPPVGAKFVQAG